MGHGKKHNFDLSPLEFTVQITELIPDRLVLMVWYYC